MRLLTFGDSWTAGHGVETDIIYKENAHPVEGKGFIVNLRRFNSWPRYVAEKLDCAFVNNGYCGAGNHDIYSEVKILFDDNVIEDDDVFIIMFSYPHRYRVKKPENDPIKVFEKLEELLKSHKRFYFNSFYPTFKDEDGFDVTTLPNHFINPNECISDMLKEYEIKNDISVWEYESRSIWNDENNFWEGDYHPNLLGYKLIADEILKQIQNRL
jgi:lysophospholipase L1-like esterase